MKILKLAILIIATVILNGCGVSDIKIDSIEDLNTEDNISIGYTTINDNNQSDGTTTQTENVENDSNDPIVDNTPIVIHDGTDSSYTSSDPYNSDSAVNDQTVNDQTDTTSNDGSSSSTIIDQNACDLPNYISDDGNDPQGVQKDGIKFTQKLSNAGEVLTFYYEKNADEKADLDMHLGDFYDENNTLMFSLSINEAYFNKGSFYIKNEYTGKCYRGNFPPNAMTPPSKIVQEVSKK